MGTGGRGRGGFNLQHGCDRPWDRSWAGVHDGMLLCTKCPKQAKSSDKEGSELVNVAPFFFFFFLSLLTLCCELAELNRGRDFKGCGIIWLDLYIRSRQLPPVSPQTDMVGQQEGKQHINLPYTLLSAWQGNGCDAEVIPIACLPSWHFPWG